MKQIRRVAACAALLIAACQVNAEQKSIDEVLETAMKQAKAAREKHMQRPVALGPTSRDMQGAQGADPAKIAEQYQSIQNQPQGEAPELMVFVSTSLPKAALARLGEQANATGAVIVLRGLLGRLNDKEAMQKTMVALQPIAKTGAMIHIDPASFKRYDVKAVPAFVLADKTSKESCENDDASAQAIALVGDVTLEYVLEKWADRPDAYGERAKVYLQRLAKNGKE